MAFRTEWKKSTRKDLRKLPSKAVAGVIEAVEALAEDPFPHGVEKLSGSEHAYRIRLGDYRVVYEVVTETKLVESSACDIERMSIATEQQTEDEQN